MAFFRTGGGGIPAALKSAMNAVLNKKFGTEKDYNPVYWSDDVNLLGMLEEKTASGAIAHIEDGADGVPLKNWLVTLPASLSGYSEVNAVRSGKNIADFNSHLESTYSDLTISANVDGSISFSGTPNRTWAHLTTDFDIDLPIGTYTLGRNASASYALYVSVRYTDGTTENFSMGSASSKTFTTIKKINRIRLDLSLLSTSTNYNETIFVMLEVGSTATSYSAYEAPTQYTASLGRTIYGGTADIVSGAGEATYKGFDLSTFTWSGGVIGGQMWCWYVDLSAEGLKLPENSAIFDGICDNYSPIRYNGLSTNVNTIALRNNGYLYVNNGSDTIEPTGNVTIALDAPETFTFTPITPTPETALGTNNFGADEGDSDVTYRSSGTVTPVPVVPTLITKTITENGTYSAEDDNADGYSEVTVNVQGGATPFIPQFTETLIGDNTEHASSFTLTEDYGNYDMVKIVWYESASSSGFLYTTPDILDEIFSVGAGKLCINKPSTNYYVCYTKSGLAWTQTNQRVLFVHEIYGVTFTNCTMTATDLYKRGTSTTDKHAVTSQISLKEYDLFMMSSIHATDGSETMPTTWLYQYPPENMSDAFSCPVPAVLQEYNANDEAFVISEYGMTAARYFMVQGIKFTSVVGEDSDPNQVNELVENDEEVIPDQLNEVVENDETEQEGENDAR